MAAGQVGEPLRYTLEGLRASPPACLGREVVDCGGLIGRLQRWTVLRGARQYLKYRWTLNRFHCACATGMCLGARNFHPSIRGFEHFPIQANKAAVTRMRKDMDDKDDDDKDDVDKDDGDDDDRSDGQDKTGIHVNRVRLGNLHAVGLQIEAGVIHCSQFWSNARHSPM
ncbi:hypothetical protein K456DRAFT_37596 [Colletotrichum gloeosporioides 23]|nr:hypothetical protein K456DRAFT_37596 [Colletotrichum gloeosporioides 23]